MADDHFGALEAWQLFHLRHASITRIDVFSTGDRKVSRTITGLSLGSMDLEHYDIELYDFIEIL